MKLFAVALGVVLAVTACSDDGSGTAATSTTDRAPSDNPASATVQEALSRIDAFFDAVNEGRVGDLEAILGRALSEGERLQYIFHGTLMADGRGWVLDSCEVAAETDEVVLVDCRAANTDPVFVAEGASEIIAPFKLQQGVLEELAWVPRGRSFETPLGSYVMYLQTFHADEFYVCDPFAQEGEVLTHGGIAKVPECGALLGPLRDDVAAWVDAGKPTD